MNIPMVIAGLKCPPLIGPSIYANPITMSPTAIGVFPEVPPQFTARSKNAVPSISQRQTTILLSVPPGTSIILLKIN